MSKLLFLPDRNGREKESDGAGLVRLSADTSEMAALAKRMVIRQETDEITPDAAYQAQWRWRCCWTAGRGQMYALQCGRLTRKSRALQRG